MLKEQSDLEYSAIKYYQKKYIQRVDDEIVKKKC